MNGSVFEAGFRPVTVRACAEAVAAHSGVTVADLLSERGPRELARLRQVAIYLAVRRSGRAVETVGRIFGGRDHKTIRYAVQVIERLIAERDPLAHLVEELDALLRVIERRAVLLPAELPDPVRAAIDLAALGDRANPSAEQLRALLAYVIQRALRDGEIAVEGREQTEDAGEPAFETASREI